MTQNYDFELLRSLWSHTLLTGFKAVSHWHWKSVTQYVSIYLIARSMEFDMVMSQYKSASVNLFCHSACRVCKPKCNPVLLRRCDGQSTCPALKVDSDWFSSYLISSSVPLTRSWRCMLLLWNKECCVCLFLYMPKHDLALSSPSSSTSLAIFIANLPLQWCHAANVQSGRVVMCCFWSLPCHCLCCRWVCSHCFLVSFFVVFVFIVVVLLLEWCHTVRVQAGRVGTCCFW